MRFYGPVIKVTTVVQSSFFPFRIEDRFVFDVDVVDGVAHFCIAEAGCIDPYPRSQWRAIVSIATTTRIRLGVAAAVVYEFEHFTDRGVSNETIFDIQAARG